MSLAEADDDLVVMATKTTDPARTAEWVDGYRLVLAAVSGSLWELDGPAPAPGPGPGHTHVALVPHPHLRDHDALEKPPSHAEIRRARWRPAGGTVVESTSAEALILAEVLCADPAREAEWDSWYDAQHLPDMLATGVFVAGSRWHREPREPHGTNHLTIYEIAGPDLSEAIAGSAAALPAMAAAGRTHPCHTGGPALALRRVP